MSVHNAHPTLWRGVEYGALYVQEFFATANRRSTHAVHCTIRRVDLAYKTFDIGIVKRFIPLGGLKVALFGSRHGYPPVVIHWSGHQGT